MATFDILVKGGTLPDGTVKDIGITGGLIAAMGDLSGSEAGEVIDARGVAAERIDALRGAVLERPDDTAALLGEWLSMDETREPA